MDIAWTELAVPGCYAGSLSTFGDSRGSFQKLFNAEAFATALPGFTPRECYLTSSARGVLRGMHFQLPPHAEMKLVSCLRGRVWDVAVDLRRGSDTVLHWHAEELSADNHRALLIPEGFAHGFQALTDDVELLYCHSTAYRNEAEAGLNPEDLKLAIEWPLEITELSDRDAHHPMIDQDFAGFVV